MLLGRHDSFRAADCSLTETHRKGDRGKQRERDTEMVNMSTFESNDWWDPTVVV